MEEITYNDYHFYQTCRFVFLQKYRYLASYEQHWACLIGIGRAWAWNGMEVWALFNTIASFSLGVVQRGMS